MGKSLEGWAEARKEIVKANIQRYEIVFLQEVPWKEEYTNENIARPAGYEVVLVRSAHENRNTCILYNAERLQCENEKTKEVTKTLAGDKRWTAYSKRLCVQVFSLKGKGDSSKFVAISLHAPKPTNDNYSFCDLMKTAIKRIVKHHKLPVLVGGDFNTNITWWEKDGFEGLDYDAGRIPIDFITMKVPRKNNHLKMDKVQKMEGENIAIPEKARSIEVALKGGSMTVQIAKENAVGNFWSHLCDYHMPLTVDIVYSDVAYPTEGAHDEDEKTSQVEDLKKENDRLKRKVKELEKEIEELKKQHEKELSKLKR